MVCVFEGCGNNKLAFPSLTHPIHNRNYCCECMMSLHGIMKENMAMEYFIVLNVINCNQSIVIVIVNLL